MISINHFRWVSRGGRDLNDEWLVEMAIRKMEHGPE